jgi:hypothetical protein
MSFKDRIKHLGAGAGAMAFAVDAAERYGATAGFGFLSGCYREKAAVTASPPTCSRAWS